MTTRTRSAKDDLRVVRSLLVTSHLTVGFGEQTVLEDLSLRVQEGEFLVIVGPSGCGKSTLLNAVSGLLEGSARIEGEIRLAEGKRLGYAFQQDALLPWFTAGQNVAVGLELRGVPKKDRRALTQELLAMMHLTDVENSYPHQLSGGMRQRIALARVLAYDADLILLDEPFGALDAFTRMTLQDELLDVWHKTGKTMVFVTHDLPEALVLATRIIVLSANPGRLHLEVDNSEWPMPRRAEELRSTDAFLKKFKGLWESLMSVGAQATPRERSETR